MINELNELERFQGIKLLNDIVIEYRTNGHAIISPEQKIMLKNIYESLYGKNINMSLDCPSCCITYISFLWAWHQREYEIFLSKQVGEPAPAEASAVKGLSEPVLSDATGGEPTIEVADEQAPVSEEVTPTEPVVAEPTPEAEAEPVADEPQTADETPIEPVAEEAPVEPTPTTKTRR